MEKFVTIDDLNICYTDEGEGKTIVLFHGWGANKEAFTPIIKKLSGYMRVVALDFPWFGKSDEPKEIWDVEHYADFMKKFLEIADCKLVPPSLYEGNLNLLSIKLVIVVESDVKS